MKKMKRRMRCRGLDPLPLTNNMAKLKRLEKEKIILEALGLEVGDKVKVYVWDEVRICTLRLDTFGYFLKYGFKEYDVMDILTLLHYEWEKIGEGE